MHHYTLTLQVPATSEVITNTIIAPTDADALASVQAIVQSANNGSETEELILLSFARLRAT
jgi:hypothetical protein